MFEFESNVKWKTLTRNSVQGFMVNGLLATLDWWIFARQSVDSLQPQYHIKNEMLDTWFHCSAIANCFLISFALSLVFFSVLVFFLNFFFYTRVIFPLDCLQLFTVRIRFVSNKQIVCIRFCCVFFSCCVCFYEVFSTWIIQMMDYRSVRLFG